MEIFAESLSGMKIKKKKKKLSLIIIGISNSLKSLIKIRQARFQKRLINAIPDKTRKYLLNNNCEILHL